MWLAKLTLACNQSDEDFESDDGMGESSSHFLGDEDLGIQQEDAGNGTEGSETMVQIPSIVADVTPDGSIDGSRPTPDAVVEVRSTNRVDGDWKAVEDISFVEDVPDHLRKRIQRVLGENLPLCTHKEDQKWKSIPVTHSGIAAFERKGKKRRKMIKCVATLDHHPKQLFNLLMNHKRRPQYENNVRYGERLKRYNSHTFIDYYAYKPVWPTSARDFLVALHWRPVQLGEETAICLFAFSYPKANNLRPVPSDHVRGELYVSMSLLRLVNSDKCELIRLISYDLGGSVPQSLSNSILQQQAVQPAVLEHFLSDGGASDDVNLNRGAISVERLLKEVIEELPEDDGIESIRRQLRFDEKSDKGYDTEEVETSGVEDKASVSESSKGTTVSKIQDIALILLTPLIIWRGLDGINEVWRSVLFIASAVVCARAVVLENLGIAVSEPFCGITGVTRCHFSIKLRSVLTYLAGKKEEVGDRDVSVVHLVVKAAAQALDEIETMNAKHVSIPWLGIDGSYVSRELDVSVLNVTTTTTLTTIEEAGRKKIEQIVECLESARGMSNVPDNTVESVFQTYLLRPLGFGRHDSHGRCLVVTSPNQQDVEIDLDILPVTGFNVVIVVGGVRLDRPSPDSASPRRGVHRPQPVLSMSLSIDNPACGVGDCKRFAKRVHQLVENPED